MLAQIGKWRKIRDFRKQLFYHSYIDILMFTLIIQSKSRKNGENNEMKKMKEKVNERSV